MKETHEMSNITEWNDYDDTLHEECGVFGMYDFDGNDVASSIYYGLFAAYCQFCFLNDSLSRLAVIFKQLNSRTRRAEFVFHSDSGNGRRHFL